MTIAVNLPDGRRVNVQTDDPAEAARVAHGFGQATPHPARSVRNTLGGLAGNYLDAMLPGAAGAVRGAREALVNAVEAPFSSSVDFHPAQSFRDGRAFQYARQRDASQAHPTAAGTLQAAGLVGGLALPAAKVARGATLGAKVLAGAKTAGAYGALSGALSSKADGAAGILSDAVSSGIASGTIGAGLPLAARAAGAITAPFRPLAGPAVRMVGRGIEGLGDVLPGSLGAAMRLEGRQVARDPAVASAHRLLDRDIRSAAHPVTGEPMRPMDVPAEVQRRQALGVPAVPADLDEGLQRSFGTAARAPGPATLRVRQAIDERQRREVERTGRHIAAALGPTANVEAQADALNAQARAAAAPLYAISDAQPIPLTSELQELLSRPGGRRAMDGAVENLRNEGRSPFKTGLIEGDDGLWREGQVPTMPTWDHAKTALDDATTDLRNPLATSDTRRTARGADSIRRRLLEIMDGDVSGPVTASPSRPPAAPYSGPEAPADLLPSGRPLASPEGLPGPWTGQRLQGEPMGASAASGDPQRSSIPPEGLNPFWKPARDAYAGPVQNRKALELGEEMAGGGAVDVSNHVAELAGSQLDHFRLGHRSGLADDVRRLPDYADAASRLAGSIDRRDAIAAAHGPEASQALMVRLSPEQDASRTFQAVRGFPSDAIAQAGQQDQRIEAAATGILQTLAGRPGAGVGNIVRALARGDRAGEVNGHIASILAEPNVHAIADAMRAAGREQARQVLVSRSQSQAFQRGARSVGTILGTNIIYPADQDADY